MKLLDRYKRIINNPRPGDQSLMPNHREIEETGSSELISASVKKFRIQYIFVLALIIFFEAVMIIRGLVYFDLTKLRRILYMVSYVLLLTFSVPCMIFMISSNKKGVVTRAQITLVYIYCIFLTVWSAGISLLDIYGGHTPIVFMTVVMGTGALAFIRPILYISIVTPLSALLAWFASRFGDSAVAGPGYLINFFVFVVFTLFIISRQFYQNKVDYVIMKKIEQYSYHDQLTGLKNRYALLNVLENFGDVFYFGMFDFDDFKKINDACGHDFGDSTLCEVAHLLEEAFDGLAFRYGGDEFVVVSTERKDEIMRRCLQINSELNKKYPDIPVQLSGGFYLPRSKDETYEDYLKYADNALYQAKDLGKGRFVFYEESPV